MAPLNAKAQAPHLCACPLSVKQRDDTGNLGAQPPPIRAPQPSTVYFTPNSPILVKLDEPARRRLDSHSLFLDENAPRIEEIITSRDETRLTDYLPDGAAQTFIDVVHEVRPPHTFTPGA